MGAQHVYSRSLAGLLLLVALVALCGGGCGRTVSQECPILEPIWSAPCLSNSNEVTREPDEKTLTTSDEPTGNMAEAGVLGYSDPADGPRDEAYLPGALSDGGTNKSGAEPEPGLGR